MYISVDMGGTNTRVAGSPDLEQLEFTNEPIRRRNTNPYENDLAYENDLDFIVESAEKIAGRQAVRAVGIGTPGTPSPDRLRIETAKNIPHWNGKPLVEPIAEALDCPVYYDNDAVAAGLGEAYYGNYAEGDFHYLIWGTGIGGASVEMNEKRDVVYAAKLPWKRHFRSWDVAGIQLERDYGKPAEKFSDAEWSDIMKKFGAHLLDYATRFDPPAVIFGGGVASKRRKDLEHIWLSTGVDAKVSDFDEDSGIVGGFGLIRYEQNPNHRPYVYQEDPED